MPLIAWLLPFAAALFPVLACAQAAVVVTPQVRAELVAHAPEGILPGKTLMLGLLLEHQPQWHTYWKNPGDSGLPTTLSWTLPSGLTAGDIQWPTPSKLPVGPLMNYGFSDLLLLPVEVRIPADFSAQSVQVQLRADWLACKEVCIPESGEFSLTVPANAATAAHGALFASARAAAPEALPDAKASATVAGNELVIRIAGLPTAWQGKPLGFFPETAGVLQNAVEPQARWEAGSWVASLPLDPQRSASPTTMPAVLTIAGREAGVQVTMAVDGAWPALASLAPLPAVLAPPLPSPAAAPAMGLLLAIGLAMVGGMLLNLMPCVFPVLSLKVLGFARHADRRGALLAGGLAYTVGVVLSFVGLAALLLTLRAGGEQLGWGFQLQSPLVVAGLAALFTLIGLNLLGVFEFRSVLPDNLAALQSRHPVVDALLTGVLAVAIAAPCTAPFMGASLGLAVTLPTAQALAVFAALGFGMALPYLAASAWPAIARSLPRPGAWMVTFRGLMAFPMFATVVWLVWVLGQQVGIDGVAMLLTTLVMMAFAVWTLAAPGHSLRTKVGLGTVAVALLGLTLGWAWPTLRATPASGAVATRAADDWEDWSVARVADATAQGRAVFVDFTAAWCVTCQFNKRTTLADAAVKSDFESRRVLRLRADWTRRDAAISAELSRLGRSGVPVYALYSPGAAQPRLLSEILSVDEVRGALAALP